MIIINSNPLNYVLRFICWSFVCFTSSYSLKYEYVTCGSVLKLINARQNIRLHSHDIKYGSGSGQQSVTGVVDIDDHNSHWGVKGTPNKPCKRGDPIRCGQEIRMEHQATHCNLHSHLFSSPLSNNQEVSCFGKKGEGDTGDYWEVQCDDSYWVREDEVRFKHRDTGTYLAATGHKYSRPIAGQREISCVNSIAGTSEWKAAEGVFIKPVEQTFGGSTNRDEL